MDGLNEIVGPIKLVVLQPTSFCNLDCSYCYLPERRLKKIMTLDILRSVVTNIFKSRYLSDDLTFVWHCGEPLMVPISFYQQAFEIIESLKQKLLASPCRIRHAFQTNGTMLTKEWCRFIVDHEIQIGVSVDGPAFLHDSNRKTHAGIGSHASTMRGIHLLTEAGIPFHVITVLTRKTMDYPDELFDFFLENNITRIGFNIDEQEGICMTSSFLEIGSEEKYYKFMKRFYHNIKNSPLPISVREFDSLRALICKGSSSNEIPNAQCTTFAILTIDASGLLTTFSPELLSAESDTYGSFNVGSLSSETLESINDCKKLNKLRADIQKGVEMCRSSCDYFQFCGGGAPANKFFENGSFISTETAYCRFKIKILVDLLLESLENQYLKKY